MKLRFLLFTILLATCQWVLATPSFIYWEEYGDVPMNIGNVPQKSTKLITVCRSEEDGAVLSTLLTPASTNNEWEISPASYHSQGSRCQNFELTVTPTTLGVTRAVILFGLCVEGTQVCDRHIQLEANVISEAEYQEKLSRGLYYTGKMAVIDDSFSNPQAIFHKGGSELWLIGSNKAKTFDVDLTTHAITHNNNKDTPFPASSGNILCDDGNRGFLEYITNGQLRLRSDDSGSVIGVSHENLLLSGSNCLTPASNLIQLVDDSGQLSSSGRIEIRRSILEDWGTVCDNGYDSVDAVVACRQLGYNATGVVVFDYCFGANPTVPIYLDNVQCSGSELRLTDCPANTFGEHNCDHNDDACATCIGSRIEELWVPISGCPTKGRSEKLLTIGCEQSIGVYSILDIDTQPLSNDVPSEDINFDDSPTPSLGFSALSSFMVDDNRILLIGADNSTLLIRQGQSFSAEHEGLGIAGDVFLTQTSGHLYVLPKNQQSSTLEWFDFTNGNLDNPMEIQEAAVSNPVKMDSSAEGIIAISQPTSDGISTVTFFMEVDADSQIPGLESLELPQDEMTRSPAMSVHQGAVMKKLKDFVTNPFK